MHAIKPSELSEFESRQQAIGYHSGWPRDSKGLLQVEFRQHHKMKTGNSVSCRMNAQRRCPTLNVSIHPPTVKESL